MQIFRYSFLFLLISSDSTHHIKIGKCYGYAIKILDAIEKLSIVEKISPKILIKGRILKEKYKHELAMLQQQYQNKFRI